MFFSTNLFIGLITILITIQSVLARQEPTHLTRKGQHVKRIVRKNLYITEDTLWTDGNPRPNSVLINGTSPGPTLRFKVGDLALVKVFNQLSNQNTTIHFHGLTQALLPSADGTPMISQWPIAPNTFFEYELFFTQDEVGTTFYHSHVSAQILTAFAPVIIEDDQTPSIIPKNIADRVLAIGDYFYASDQTIVSQLLGTPFQWPGSAQAISLNGKSWPTPGSCNTTIAKMANVVCTQTTYSGPEVIDVEFDQSYRLRWIGAQSLMHLAIGIFNHSQTIVAVDGEFIHPIKNQTFFEIMAGQRYDSLLETKTETEVQNDEQMKGCYPIRFETRWRTPETNGWAMLRYPGAKCDVGIQAQYPHPNPINYLPPSENFWISNQFHPLKSDVEYLKVPKDSEVTRRVYLESQQIPLSNNVNSNYPVRWDINGQVYNETNPKVNNNTQSLQTPYLIELYQGKKPMPSYFRGMHPPPGVQVGYDWLTNTFVGKAGEVIDIIILNNQSALNHQTETHPWHFHSQKHWTIAMGLGNFTEKEFERAKKEFYPAIARDTSGVWPGIGASVTQMKLTNHSSGAWTAIRYRIPENKSATGVWMFHCHWSFHLIMGMATTWYFGPIQNDIQVRYSDPDYYTFGRNVSAPFIKNHF